MEDELACFAFLNASFQSVRSENNKKTKVQCFRFANLPLPLCPRLQWTLEWAEHSYKQVDSGQSLACGSLISGVGTISQLSR